jgi:LPXTG-site transpeptidase (sortase) family protein
VAYLLSKVLETSRSLLKRLKEKQKPFLLILFGLFILSFGLTSYYRLRILSFTKPPEEAETVFKGELPVQITIPSIEIDLPVEVGEIKDGLWQVSSKNATFLSSSARPGTGGNVVIYGHNKKVIFGNLPYLSLGQKIYLKMANDEIYAYEAYKKDFTSPDKIELVSPTDHEELTVYTCWGLLDLQRVVIKAKPLF